jgi:murein L,D-transpeptidase YcbB/YkuD
MKYKKIISGLFLMCSIGWSGFFGDGWVSRYPNDINDSTFQFGSMGRYSPMVVLDTSSYENSSDKNSSNPSDKSISKKTPKIDKSVGVEDSELKNIVEATKASGLIALYKRVGFEKIWLNKKGLKGVTKELFKIIKSDLTLPKSSNSKRKVVELSKRAEKLYKSSKPSSRQKILLDMEISKLYLNYTYYKVYGGINWGRFNEKLKVLTKKYKIKVGWDYYRPPLSPIDILTEAVAVGSLRDVLNGASPKRFKYKKLEKKLIQYMELAKKGGWKTIPSYKRVKPNQKSPIIPKIRARLKLEDEARKCPSSKSETYDKCLQKAVFRYKVRHGLKVDKIIDSSLRKALNIPISKKIAMIRLNLDRIKWLYRDEEPLRIELNIPSFRLNFYEKNALVTTIRVVVGKSNHPTPIFHNVMRYVVVNPYWKIPESIVKHEMLKHLIRDPYYYERRGKVLRESWDENSRRVDPGSINWSKYRAKDKHIPYYFMQVPGSRNALGKIKFLFPNKYSVYIHDTPSKRLFFRTSRAFSHGCMRIQKPKELLKILAHYNENIDVDSIMEKLGTTEKETISLKKVVPVDITYLTAFVDDYNNIHFRKDIYNYDKYQFKDYKYPDLIGKKKDGKSKSKGKKKGKKSQKKRGKKEK